MRLYRVVDDDAGEAYVEADNFGEAVRAWQAALADAMSDDAYLTTQPETVMRLSDEPVIRAKATP